MTVGKIANHRNKLKQYGAGKIVGGDGTEYSFDDLTEGKYLYVSGSQVVPRDASLPAGVIIRRSVAGATNYYTTITDALSGAVPGDLVTVGPGSYSESVTVPSQVTLLGTGRASVVLSGSTATGTRCVLENNAAIDNMLVVAPSDATPAISSSAQFSCFVDRIVLFGTNTNGCGIKNSGAGTMFVGSVVLATGQINCLLHQDGPGTMFSNQLSISGTGSVVDGVRVSNGQMVVGSMASYNPGVVDFVSADGGHIHISSTSVHNCTNAIHITSNDAEVNLGGFFTEANTYDILVDPGITGSSVHMTGGSMSRERISYDAEATGVHLLFHDGREDDEGFIVHGELAVGRPNRGDESCFGEGDSFVDGMVVLTTDDTADTGVDGGNLTDVSAEAKSASDSTFTFQGATDGHAILFGANVENTTDFIKHWGIKVKQTTAAVEISPKSFIFEVWNGTAWAEINVMATHSSAFYPYANEVFVRANSSEHVRYGITDDTTWAKKTIDSKNLYWARIRIATTVTTAPVFQQFKLSTNRSEINSDGTHTFHGRSRFRSTLSAAGNIFGEEGSAASIAIGVGSGGSPTGWNHNVKNSELNANGDGIHWQFSLPYGIDTSQPVNLAILFTPTPAGAGAATGSMSMLPVEVIGVPVADPAFGLVPTARTAANTETLTAKVAQTQTDTEIDASNTGKIVRLEFNGFDISDYYEGDMLFFRFVMTDDGANNVDLTVLTAEISAVQWKHGERL